MSKVITFSTVFPSYHPRKGEPTNFVEKIWNEVGGDVCNEDTFKIIHSINGGSKDDIQMFFDKLDENEFGLKKHTIRSGKRWEVGDIFSPRVWSGKPYHSKQIIIAPDIEIKKIWDFEMDLNGIYSINGKYINDDVEMQLAKNDGFENWIDMLNWFMRNYNRPKEFRGQIICWDEKLNY